MLPYYPSSHAYGRVVVQRFAMLLYDLCWELTIGGLIGGVSY